MSKFIEGLNTAVFTTKYVINKSYIANVFHYRDGSWQFNGIEGNLEDSDYKVVSLGEILSMDNSIEELANMPVGFCATRNNESSQWEINPLDD